MTFNEISTLFIPLLAIGLDLLLKDPQGWPHPVRLIGRVLDAEEAWGNDHVRGSVRAYGWVCLVLNALVVFGAVWLLTNIPYLGALIALYFAYAGLSLGQLLAEGRNVSRLLAAGDLPTARIALGRLVSRETRDMDAATLRRTLAETVSENLNDGFVAPMFYLALGGTPLMWLYKCVSTMDSMWGYKTERFRELGYAAAKVDDVLAFLPARITAFAMMGAGWFMKLPVDAAYEHTRDDALRTESPNAGWPMAAAAWLLGARVGGPAVYFGEVKDKPLLGPADAGTWDDTRLSRLLQLVLVTGLLSGIALHLYFYLLFWAAAAMR